MTTAVTPPVPDERPGLMPEPQAARPPRKAAVAERRCLVSGELLSRKDLIRFVIAPDATVIPDLSENLPGTGLWVTASADAVTAAAKKNLFAKAAQTQAKPPADLAERTIALLRQRCLSLFGMAKGAGIATLGESQTESALRDRKLGLHLRAPDSGRTLDNRYNIAECTFFSRDELGAAFGYDHIVYAGLAPHGLTDKVKREISRLQSMTEKSV